MVKYWLTFNEINCITSLPYYAAGVVIRSEEERLQQIYTAVHHELVASAWAVKIAHEIDKNNMVGCMLAAGVTYPYRCAPEDVWLAHASGRGKFFFSDVLVRGEYPEYKLKEFERIGFDIPFFKEDKEVLKNQTMFANQLKEENVNLNNNTTMKQLDLNMKLLEKNVKSLKTNFMPTLSMSFSYQYQSLYNPNINFFDYNWSNSSSLMFNISIPLYKASNFTKVKSARIQMRQLDWNRIDTERQLNMQIVSCRNNMSASTEQVVSNKENVMQAKKAVVIAEKRYDVGKGTVLELNSSQVSLTQAQLTYNQSIYDYLVAKADLDQVLGKE